MKYRPLVVVVLGLSLVAGGARAATDISGTWQVTTERAGGPVQRRV